MTLRLSRLHFPVTTLGFGRRVGIWFQGCSIRCPGCVSRDTWDFDRGGTTVEAVMETLGEWLPGADGVTVSGGEPFDQPEALGELLRQIRACFPGDVLVFSGHPSERLAGWLANEEGLVDVLISDPFDARAGQTLALRGSDNQRVHLLTPMGRARHAGLGAARRGPKPALDLVIDGSTAWMAGIPAPGDLERLREALHGAGFGADLSAAPVWA